MILHNYWNDDSSFAGHHSPHCCSYLLASTFTTIVAARKSDGVDDEWLGAAARKGFARIVELIATDDDISGGYIIGVRLNDWLKESDA